MYAEGKPPLSTTLFSAAIFQWYKGSREKGEGLGLVQTL